MKTGRKILLCVLIALCAAFLACGDRVIFIKGSREAAEAVKREVLALFGKFTEYSI